MLPEHIEELLKPHFSHHFIEVTGDGHHFTLKVVAEIFAGRTKLQRQQFIYGLLNEKIRSGAIHAVMMHLYTPEEWAASSTQTNNK